MAPRELGSRPIALRERAEASAPLAEAARRLGADVEDWRLPARLLPVRVWAAAMRQVAK